MCRIGEQDPYKFGIFDMHRLDFVHGNLVVDVPLFNEMELLPWDYWGVILNEQLDAPTDLGVLDEVFNFLCATTPIHSLSGM